jgi:hypothetical protein
MFLVDTEQGRIVGDEELKEEMAARKPYRQWLDENLVQLKDLKKPVDVPPALDADTLLTRQQVFGYTIEDLRLLMAPMAVNAQEAVGSMGTDTPLACLSERPQLLFNYFKQLFAQVTNPPIDPIREELVMSLETNIGSEQNLFQETPLHCRQLHLKSPILSNEQLAQVKALDRPGLHSTRCPFSSRKARRRGSARRARGSVCARVEGDRGRVHVLVLSDRTVDESHVPIPSLLATAAVHHHLIREGTRMRAGLVLESGSPGKCSTSASSSATAPAR